MAPRPKPGSKIDRDTLRAEMAAGGAPFDAIAKEMRSRYGFRPREAWRHAHGLTLQQAADAFNNLSANRPGGPAADASLLGKWEKWPSSSGRRVTLTVLTVLADLYGCGLDDLLDLDDRRALPDADLRLLRHRSTNPLSTPPSRTDRPLTSEDLIHAAAHESAQWAQWAEASNVGDIALEQLLIDTQYLATAYLTQDPLAMFSRTKSLRDRVFRILEGHQTPSQSRDLYVAAGFLCGLLAWMTSDLGYLPQADTHGRTAWLCAELADHTGLRAWVCSTRSKVAFWDGRLREAVQHARRGSTLRPPGTAAVLLACQEADAWSELGATTEAQAALRRAATARDEQTGLDDIGGLFSCSAARHANYASAVHLRTGTAQAALAHAERGMDELARLTLRAYGTEAQLHISRARAYLIVGDAEGVTAAADPVLALAADHRTAPVTQRLRELAREAARSPMGDSVTGLHLQDAIDVFCRESTATLALANPLNSGLDR